MTVIAINKKGASPAVYNTVETLQQPELQLIEEKIPVQAEMADGELVVGVGLGVGVAVTLLVLMGVAVRRSSCGRGRREYRGGGGGSEYCSGSESECMQSIQTIQRPCLPPGILKNKQNCDNSSPDLIPHHDQSGQ